MSLTHWWVIAGGVLLLALWLVAVLDLGVAARPLWRHHEWIGLALVLAPAAWGAVVYVLWPLGLAIQLDDTVQHTIQEDDPAFQSLLHRLYVLVVRWLIRQPWCPAPLARFLAR